MSTEDLLRSRSYLNSMSPQSDDATAAPVDAAAVGAPTAHEPESGPNGSPNADAGSVHAMTPHGQVPPPPQDSVVVDINDTDGDAKARRGTHCGDLEQAELDVTWEDLTYTIPIKKKVDGKKTVINKVILNKVTGAVKSGEMVCVMGTSGSGKTSFLNVLAGRYSVGHMTGQVLCNGKRRDTSFKRSIGYVEQDDLMFANLTVTEMLMYTALLRLPTHLSREDKLLRANEVLEQLGLNDCRHTRIGSEGTRGISGGERKRTSIAIELITNPRILFLDEPSSGLDSYTATHVLQTIKQLTKFGRSVICSIHQPRDKIFQLFDKMLLLARGETCYFGPRVDTRRFLQQCGHIYPPGENEADWLLDLTTIDQRTASILAETENTVKGIVKAYSSSEYRAAAVQSVHGVKAAKAHQGDIEPIKRGSRLSFGEEFSILRARAWKLVIREPKATKVAFFQATFMGLLTGIIFYDLGTDQKGIRDRQGFLFFALIGNVFPSLTGSVMLFHSEKRVFNRERRGGAYRVSSYFFSKSTTDMPVAVLPVFVYFGISYFMVGLVQEVDVFFKSLLMLVAVVTSGQSLGIFISAATPTIQVGQAMAPLCMILLIMFGGFYLQIDSIPIWLSWLEVFSFFQYAFVGLLRVQFEGQKFSCQQSNLCLATGEAVLADMGVDGDDRDFWYEFGKVMALTVFFRTAAYFSLRFLHRKTLRFE
eukprot:m.35651 g.35651  ORF g.35651 m.35651 type:complete len:705 (+) comp12791_c0_seq2:79-2193(+)